MKLKIGYLYRDGYGDIYTITNINVNLPIFNFAAKRININGNIYESTFTISGKFRSSKSPFDLIEEIGKIEDYPEYFL